jgi:uncharacterized protein YjbI with pentapeptide repeats
MSTDLIIGWFLGVASSLLTGVVLFWLEGKREIRREALKQRLEDTRIARNWANEGKEASLRSFDLAGANLSGKDLSGADLEDASFEGAKMWSTNLSGANLIRADFRRAKLFGVNLSNTKLLLADFTGAILSECDFTGAKFRRTKLKPARKIDQCIWRSIQIDETTELSEKLRQEIEKAREPAVERDETV